jgi:adenosylmethionine-8-amino-7-oxononanoate aminotransferase
VVEGSLKLARQIQQARGEKDRHLIIGRWQSYHVMTLGALAVSGRPGLRAPYLEMLRDMPHIAPPYTYREPVSGTEAANRLEACILEYGAGKIAAFIAEPISGASLGAAVPPDDYWPRVRQICDQYGVLLIADEVLVGLGRTGKWWGIDHWQVQPDILVTSKGLAGGYFPLGFIAAKHEDVELIRQKLGDWNHGGTFSHHAVGCAAALATLHIIEREGLVKNSARMGELMGQQLQKTLGGHPNIGDIRGRGLFWGIELVQDRETKRPFPAAAHLDWRIWERAFDLGLVVYHSQGCADGRDGDLIMLGPPLMVNEAEVKQMIELLTQAICEELSASVNWPEAT